MKAAVIHEYGQSLRIEELPALEAGPDEVIIEVEACGVCHSDIHLAEGDWPQMRKIVKLPLILGHEVAGRIVECGSQVRELKVGARAGVAWLHWACGECEQCKAGLENLCPSQLITGATTDGGFAQYIRAKASHVIPVPEHLESSQAAPLFCAGVTVYRAIKNAGVRPGQRVAVFGVGGLGHLAVQIVRVFGAEVIAVDLSESKLELARTFGAENAVNASVEDPVKRFRGMGGADAAIVTSAAKEAYDAAFYSLKPAGTLVVVGLPAEPLSFPAIALVARETKIVSSAVGTRQDLREILALAAAGKVRCHIESRRLEDINDIFQQMRSGQLTGRVVVDFGLL